MLNRNTLCLFAPLLLAAPASANLRRVTVTQASQQQQQMPLTILITESPSTSGVYTVDVTAPPNGNLKAAFGVGLFIGEGGLSYGKPFLADVPLEPRRKYSSASGYTIQFRLAKGLLNKSTLYFRCGSPLSEVRYEVALATYLPRNGQAPAGRPDTPLPPPPSDHPSASTP